MGTCRKAIRCKRRVELNKSFRGTTEDIPESPTGKKEEEIRSTFKLTVGDAKSTSTLRGVRNRAPDEFGCFHDVPGDFHTQGYVMECPYQRTRWILLCNETVTGAS